MSQAVRSGHVCMLHWLSQWCIHLVPSALGSITFCSLCVTYSGLPLIWPPLGPVEGSRLEGWPHFRARFALGSTLWDILKWPQYWPHFRGSDCIHRPPITMQILLEDCISDIILLYTGHHFTEHNPCICCSTFSNLAVWHCLSTLIPQLIALMCKINYGGMGTMEW